MCATEGVKVEEVLKNPGRRRHIADESVGGRGQNSDVSCTDSYLLLKLVHETSAEQGEKLTSQVM